MNESSFDTPILGTLGNSDGFLTCSMYVAKRWNRYRIIKPYPKYELAAQDVKRQIIDSFLVPAAYPNIRTFIMDSELVVTDAFVEQIPSLVCATKTKEINHIDRIYLHPATESLVDEVPNKSDNLKIIFVDSNIEVVCPRY